MDHQDHGYFLSREKAELILNKYGIKLPEFTSKEVLVKREHSFGKYNTFIECRDSWGFGVEIWVEKKKMCYASSLGDPDREWEDIPWKELL